MWPGKHRTGAYVRCREILRIRFEIQALKNFGFAEWVRVLLLADWQVESWRALLSVLWLDICNSDHVHSCKVPNLYNL